MKRWFIFIFDFFFLNSLFFFNIIIGNKLLAELNESLNKNYCQSKDIIDAAENIKQMLNQLEQKQVEFSTHWNDFDEYLDYLKTLIVLSDGIKVVTKWILSTGEELVSEQHKIGSDLETTETLRDKHDELEMKCIDAYASYAELNYKIKRFLNEKYSFTMKSVPFKNLLAQRRFMDFICRSFASRLEKRRIILTKCVRFYRLVTTYFERTGQVFEQHIVGNKVKNFDTCLMKLRMLRESKNSMEHIVDELKKDGEQLSDVLSMPLKDVLGRDTGIDYSSEISMIRDIMKETINRRKIFCESVELQILTFEQIIHIHTYEQDALMANKWIDDLLAITIKTHFYVGCNILEIQRQKQNLQKIQDTAKVRMNRHFILVVISLDKW